MLQKTKTRLASLMTAGVLLFSQTAYAAKSMSDLKNDLASKQKETNTLKKQIQDKKGDKNDATARRQELDVEISGIEDEIDDVQAVINEKQSEINSANAKIEGLNKDIENTSKQLKARMKVMYEYGNTSYLEIIMESKGFSDLFTRVAAVQAIVKHDNSVLDKYASQVEELTAAKQLVENEKQEQVEAKQLLTGRKDKLETLQAEKDQLIKQLNNDIAALEAEEQQKEKDAQAIQNEINKALEAQKKAAAAAAAKAAKSGTAVNTAVTYKGNGKFLWPSASSTTITSKFGYRIHPISGKKSLHRGIDISAPAGSNVLAAEAGVVLTAGYNGSYGNYVVINHGGGYVTLYAHNSKLVVKAGDSVTRGQTIAKCGSTGNSTGNHIHFEVQVNGGLVNPLNYL